MPVLDVKRAVQSALQAFATTDLASASLKLWETLGYQSDKRLSLPTDPQDFWDSLPAATELNQDKVQLEHWKAAHFLLQLTNDEIPSLAYGQLSRIAGDTSYQKGMIESFVLLAVELTPGEWTRTELIGITRELNRAFPMPVIVLFKYGGLLSIAVIDRRANKRDAGKDVIDRSRIAIIKDVDVKAPHRAHLEILNDLALANVGEKHTPSNFQDLYKSWLRVLSVKELNKRFYDELFTWYCWALKNTAFPKGQTPDGQGQPSVAVIRLLTRLIFVWFVKEKGVVPGELFHLTTLDTLLKEPPTSHPESSSYYKAILQNLFFATLNTETGERRWKADGKKPDGTSGMTSHYLVHSLYRYHASFKDPDKAFDFFTRVPFLNGGLFECLDREVSARDLERNPGLAALAEKEGKADVLRVDGFSDRPKNLLAVPNKLFFSPGEPLDLNAELHTKGRKPATVRGLIEIFSRYKFTIEENTPVEEEVALDPELLGKVFENLLASYNEDTGSTARKQSGSFYTPREVVDYMVDESLVAYFESRLPAPGDADPDADAPADRLRPLLAFGDHPHTFEAEEVTQLISAIEALKTLDPACGSGAFPMGMLQKLVHVLGKLDPDNTGWKAQNRAPLERQLKDAESIPDPTLRETKVEDAVDALEKMDRAFSNKHYRDYSRKLYLVEKCLFGVDIQPIAVQIAKLRFFISLVVSQKVNPDAPAENFNITPLPNLETKLAAANSLLPIERPAQGSLRDVRIDQKEDDLHLANERHFAARSTKAKRKWREKITDLRDELADLLEQDSLLTKESAKQVVSWDPFDQNASAGFFDPEWMFGLRSGFDIVIGNPPYVRHEGIQAQKPDFKKIYDAYTGTADLYVYFYERSVKLLTPGGTLAFITSNKWYLANYGTRLREWMNRNTLLRRVIDFGDEAIFTALAYPTIVIATRRAAAVKEPAAGDVALALNWQRGMPTETFPDVFEEHAFAVPQTSLKAGGWQLEETSGRDLLAKVLAVGEPLNIWCKRRFYRGITTGLNEAFIIDGSKRKELIAADPKSAEIIKPVLRGRDIKRWQVAQQDLWIIFTRHGIDIDQYPAVKKHLERFKAQLMPKPKGALTGLGRKPGTYEWFEIQDNSAYSDEFSKPKVFMPSIERDVKYAPVLGEVYGNNKTHFVVTDRWAYLSSVLNSTVSWWFTQQVFTTKQGGYYEFIPQFVGQIPIPEPSEEQEALFKVLVDVILAGHHVYQIEQLINGLVYELFFPDELHPAGITLFDAADKAGVGALSSLTGEALTKKAEALAAVIFKNDHPIYRMLFDLQALPTVRIIEGKD